MIGSFENWHQRTDFEREINSVSAIFSNVIFFILKEMSPQGTPITPYMIKIENKTKPNSKAVTIRRRKIANRKAILHQNNQKVLICLQKCFLFQFGDDLGKTDNMSYLIRPAIRLMSMANLTQSYDVANRLWPGLIFSSPLFSTSGIKYLGNAWMDGVLSRQID